MLHPQQPRAPAIGTAQERRIYALWASGVSDVDIARCMALSVPAVQRVRALQSAVARLGRRVDGIRRQLDLPGVVPQPLTLEQKWRTLTRSLEAVI
ncbi:hypothetical protein [Streptomyces sp. NPDC056160]|uniref:hypothetical protein n=1 Tax=Streptomyces sp. NPDC056160 TaxID=3345731 RepID=UPI0035D81F16